MQIAILGTGNIGGGLGEALAPKGHQIVYGVRDPESQKTQTALSKIGSAATATSIPEAVKASSIIFLAVPWKAAREVLQEAGDLIGKTLVDCTNRMGVPLHAGQSTLEEIAKMVPGAHVLKTFNMIPFEMFQNPKFGEINASAFYCGDPAGDKATLKQLGQEIGFDMYDLGGLESGVLMDGLFQTFVALASGEKLGRRLAFKILTSKDDK